MHGSTPAAALPLDLAVQLLGQAVDQAAAEPGIGPSRIEPLAVNGEWDIPELRTLLETVISGRKTIEAFEVELYFPSIGQRKMLLNARKAYRPGKGIQQILLAIEDTTERVRLERQHARQMARSR